MRGRTERSAVMTRRTRERGSSPEVGRAPSPSPAACRETLAAVLAVALMPALTRAALYLFSAFASANRRGSIGFRTPTT